MEMLSFSHVVLFLITMLLPLTGANNFTLIYSNSSIAEGDHIARPGCPHKCGNLTVPFPFGIGPGCYADRFFEIECDASFNPPKAFLTFEELEVLGIYDTKLLVKNGVAYSCFDKFANMTKQISHGLNLSGTPFWISSQNTLNVLGCDDVCLLSLDLTDYDDYSYVSSCVSICNKTQDLTDGSCSGIGCCQSSIPEGLQSFYVQTYSLNDHRFVHSFNPCGFAFVAEQNSYPFQVSDLAQDASLDNFSMDPGPVVIEWAIGYKNCSQIQNRRDVLCQPESICVDSGIALGGYRCNCSQGFYGNPYLSPGCQDINECELDPCVSTATCNNVHGSYNCSCNGDNNFGDGLKDGVGCHRVSPVTRPLYTGLQIGFGSVSALLFSFGLFKVLKKRTLRKRKEKLFKRNGGLLLQQQTSGDDHLMEKMKLFTSRELEKATDRFNESRILGKGGQGTVYKGMLVDGRIVAIKMSKQFDENRLEEFINEVGILSQINHRNIVKLLGCCFETEVPLLVYEFISNGTLFDLIHDDGTNFPFSWKMRLKIASEVANALAYLHYANSVPVYHRDMKTTNILLDEKYRAKLADFGISRSVSMDQTHLTTKVKGTFGYLDPEYFQTCKFTEKSDVYSFGVVLVELLTGEKPISTSTTEEERSLVTRFLFTMESGSLNSILDVQIIEEGVNEEHFAAAKLAQRCLNFNGRRRPNIREVAMELENIRGCEEPSFIESIIEDVNEMESFAISINDLTLTENADGGVTNIRYQSSGPKKWAVFDFLKVVVGRLPLTGRNQGILGPIYAICTIQDRAPPLQNFKSSVRHWSL